MFTPIVICECSTLVRVYSLYCRHLTFSVFHLFHILFLLLYLISYIIRLVIRVWRFYEEKHLMPCTWKGRESHSHIHPCYHTHSPERLSVRVPRPPSQRRTDLIELNVEIQKDGLSRGKGNDARPLRAGPAQGPGLLVQ